MTSQGARNKRKGAQWETDLREGLRAEGLDVESLRLHGTEDEGDMVIREDDGHWLVIEAKNARFEPGSSSVKRRSSASTSPSTAASTWTGSSRSSS